MDENDTIDDIEFDTELIEKLKDNLDEKTFRKLIRIMGNSSAETLGKIENHIEKTNEILEEIRDALERIANK